MSTVHSVPHARACRGKTSQLLAVLLCHIHLNTYFHTTQLTHLVIPVVIPSLTPSLRISSPARLTAKLLAGWQSLTPPVIANLVLEPWQSLTPPVIASFVLEPWQSHSTRHCEFRYLPPLFANSVGGNPSLHPSLRVSYSNRGNPGMVIDCNR